MKPLFESSEWTLDLIKRTYDAIEEVALQDLGLNVYPNQIEIVSAEQMLDMYASFGLPRMYRHWSFGKRFMREEAMYRKGRMGLAYELVINSVPCISYNMADNTMAMQAFVMAHAAFGHNHFFKNNYLFKTRTDAEGVLHYLGYARRYVAHCEERYGVGEVEKTLDAAHALMNYGVDRHERPPELTKRERKEREERARLYREESFDDLMTTTIPGERERFWESLKADPNMAERLTKEMMLPEDNLLYFLGRYSPKLEEWQREILKIVRYIAEYFYPQKQTKVMNEGCATFVHFYIMNALRAKGLLTDGAMLEILHNHSNVVFQPTFDDPRYQGGFNPYSLGWSMMQDIARIATGRENWTIDPYEKGSYDCTAEQKDQDREWFGSLGIIGADWRDVLKDAWANFRDESFILQYLSPRLMREYRMFLLLDDRAKPEYKVWDIADERGYRQVRRILARQQDINIFEPPIEVHHVDLLGDRKLNLCHKAVDLIPLNKTDRRATLEYVKYLWGYPVRIETVNPKNGTPMSWLSTESGENKANEEAAAMAMTGY